MCKSQLWIGSQSKKHEMGRTAIITHWKVSLFLTHLFAWIYELLLHKSTICYTRGWLVPKLSSSSQSLAGHCPALGFYKLTRPSWANSTLSNLSLIQQNDDFITVLTALQGAYEERLTGYSSPGWTDTSVIVVEERSSDWSYLGWFCSLWK